MRFFFLYDRRSRCFLWLFLDFNRFQFILCQNLGIRFFKQKACKFFKY